MVLSRSTGIVLGYLSTGSQDSISMCTTKSRYVFQIPGTLSLWKLVPKITFQDNRIIMSTAETQCWPHCLPNIPNG